MSREFRATLCFPCKYRAEAEGFSRCLHPLAEQEQIARLSEGDEVGPLRICVSGPYAKDFNQAYPSAFNEMAIQSCEGIDRLPMEKRA